MWLSVTLLSEKASENEKKKKKKIYIAASSDKQGSRILRSTVVCF